MLLHPCVGTEVGWALWLRLYIFGGRRRREFLRRSFKDSRGKAQSGIQTVISTRRLAFPGGGAGKRDRTRQRLWSTSPIVAFQDAGY